MFIKIIFEIFYNVKLLFNKTIFAINRYRIDLLY